MHEIYILDKISHKIFLIYPLSIILLLYKAIITNTSVMNRLLTNIWQNLFYKWRCLILYNWIKVFYIDIECLIKNLNKLIYDVTCCVSSFPLIQFQHFFNNIVVNRGISYSNTISIIRYFTLVYVEIINFQLTWLAIRL